MTLHEQLVLAVHYVLVWEDAWDRIKSLDVTYDVVEQLETEWDLAIDKATRVAKELGYTFMFDAAKHFHLTD